MRTRAFTLLELLIVLLIIGILIAIGLYRYQSVVDAAEEKKVATEVRAAFIGSQAFKVKNDSYVDQADLVADLDGRDGIEVTGFDGTNANVPSDSVGVHVPAAGQVIVARKNPKTNVVNCIHDTGSVILRGELVNDICVQTGQPVSTTPSPVDYKSASLAATLIVKNDGTAWAFGRNSDGELCVSGGSNTNTPVDTGLTDVREVATGNNHSLFLKNDGTVWGCGGNTNSQLAQGSSTPVSSSTPLQIKVDASTALTNIVSIATTSDGAIALNDEGKVYTWGYNGLGQAGLGNTNNVHFATEVSGLPPIDEVGGGYYHTLALGQDGTLWAAGRNEEGELGAPIGSSSNVFVQVQDASGVIEDAVSISRTVGFSSFAVRGNDNTLYGWGRNEDGQTGTTSCSTPCSDVLFAGPVLDENEDPLTGVEVASSGLYHSVVLKNNGDTYSMGQNGSSQLGQSNSPCCLARQTNLPAASEVNAGLYHSLAISSNQVWGVGFNLFGSMGSGAMFGSYSSPVQGMSL